MKPRDYSLDSLWKPFTANRQYKSAPRLIVSADAGSRAGNRIKIAAKVDDPVLSKRYRIDTPRNIHAAAVERRDRRGRSVEIERAVADGGERGHAAHGGRAAGDGAVRRTMTTSSM